ncbi:hypothetical protein HNY73_011357 [Argiope bruennichi]|uniref:Uncharacterized protein n=1 Tax=Argiope bruennichi TaxID=94029 RepID=A0A8T0F3W6_ARGBR|nr:hypothetical protein HNY73_011357 [Argiope bruennichi]
MFFLHPLILRFLGARVSGAKNTTADEIQTAMQFPLAVNDAFKTILDFVKPPEGKVPAPSPYQMEMANAMLVDRDFNILQS